MDCDFHIHSNYSFDSLMSPTNIVRAAKWRGLSVISITDHGTMEVYEEELSHENREKLFKDIGVLIIKGMEIKTEFGDVIGLFLDEEIASTSFDDVVQKIKEQNGIVVLPHPFHRSIAPHELAGDVDLLEVVNGRCKPEQNERALRLSESTGKPTLGGSDAHMYWEIGKIRTSFPEVNLGSYNPGGLKHHLLESERNVKGSPLPFLATHGVSFASSRVKALVQQVRR